MRFAYAYLFGAVCQARTATAALVLPRSDTDAFALHLAEISRTVVDGAHAVVVVDGAPWHGARALVVPDNLTPRDAPVETVWEYLRGNRLASVWPLDHGSDRAAATAC